jgi:phosphoenolpyruvate---glycerone phosphotransferase subunit DhaL
MLRSTPRRCAGASDVATPTIGTAAVHTATITAWMGEITAAVRAEREYLTQLDGAIGDGDHGINMSRGFDAVSKALAVQDPATPPGRLLIVVGKTLVSTVGGASGPLWGTAFRRAGRTLGDAEQFDGAELVAALDAALAGIVELGAAAPEDKTMVDALSPALSELRRGLDDGQALDVALAGAAQAAEEGARATTPMQARKGRASYLGERSIGHQDPGATSAALIMAALESAVEREN